MGDLISFDGARDEKEREDRAHMVERLEQLLAQAKEGELIAVSFVAIQSDREGLAICHLRTGDCGLHELVGATRILADSIAKAAVDQEK